MADPTPTISLPTGTLAKIKALLADVDRTVQKYYTHLSAQAIAWYTIGTHDLSKWESAVSVLGTAGVVGTLKKLQAWLAKA